MPIKVADLLPATSILEKENIFVMTEYRAMHQDIRPLDVLILNLMPTKEVTETQLLRKLSNTPLQVNVEFLQTASYTPLHADSNHMAAFYTTFDQIRDRKFDGMIITGAPLDHVRFAFFLPSFSPRLSSSLCRAARFMPMLSPSSFSYFLPFFSTKNGISSSLSRL